MALVGGGGYAEYAVAYDNHLMPIPDSMSFEEAACVNESYITAFLNVFMIGGLQDGQTALLHGGGGGVNTAAIQLAKALTPKAKLIVTAHPSKIERVKELGVDLVIDFTETPTSPIRSRPLPAKRCRCHSRSCRSKIPQAQHELPRLQGETGDYRYYQRH